MSARSAAAITPVSWANTTPAREPRSPFTPITGLSAYATYSPIAVSGNNLFVTTTFSPNPFLPGFVGPYLQVGEYNATTGAAINATETGSVTTVAGTATVTFTTPFSQIPTDQIPTVTCAVLPGGSPDIIVATVSGVTTTGFVVDTVDTSTGLPANVTVDWSATGGTGGIAEALPLWSSSPLLAVSGNNLFVGITAGGTIGEYNVSTGAVINANLITGLPLFGVTALAVSGNNLFVGIGGGGGTSFVGEYNATTGAGTLITGLNEPTEPTGLAVSGNNLFVANFSASTDTSTVSEYDVSTNPATLIKANFITGLTGTVGLAVAGSTSSECPPLSMIYSNDTGARGLLVSCISNQANIGMQCSSSSPGSQGPGGETTASVRVKNNLRVWLEQTSKEPNPNNPLLPPPTLDADLNAGTEGLTANFGLLPPCTTKNPISACDNPGVSAWTAAFCGGGDIKISFRFGPRSAIITLADGVLGRIKVNGKELPGGIPSLVLGLSADLDALPDLHQAAMSLGNFDLPAASVAIFKFSHNPQEVHKAVEIFKTYLKDLPGDIISDRLLVDLINEASALIVLEIQTATSNLMTIDISGQ